MKNSLPSLALLLLCSSVSLAQQTPPATAAPLKKLVVVDSIQVTTTIEPLPLAESDRSVEVLYPREMPVGINTPIDLLRTDPSLNVQARGPEGVQTDLSIRGTTFEQSLI